MFAVFSAFFQAETVFAAGVITCVMFIALTAYVWFAPVDFNKWPAIACSVFGALLGFGLVFAFMSTRPLHAFYCLIVVVLYCCFLVCDTEAVLGKAKSGKFGYDDYLMGAVTIYMVSGR